MQNPRLATRYAKSILDLAIEKNQLEMVFTDMVWLNSVCLSSKEFVNLLRSPIIKADKKQKIVEAITKNNICDLTTAFNRLLILKTRESYLPEIAEAFIKQYKTYNQIHTIKLTTATTLSEETKTAIINQVKKDGGLKNVELNTQVNPKLIGGFILQTGDKLIDASIAYNLKNIAKQFENNDFVYQIR